MMCVCVPFSLRSSRDAVKYQQSHLIHLKNNYQLAGSNTWEVYRGMATWAIHGGVGRSTVTYPKTLIVCVCACHTLTVIHLLKHGGLKQQSQENTHELLSQSLSTGHGTEGRLEWHPWVLHPLLCGGRTSLLDLESWSSWEMPRSSDSPDSSLMKLEGNIPVFPLRTPSHHPSSTCTHVNRRTEARLRLDIVFPSFLSHLYRAKCKAHAGRAVGLKASKGTGNETADLTEPRDSGTGRGLT